MVVHMGIFSYLCYVAPVKVENNCFFIERQAHREGLWLSVSARHTFHCFIHYVGVFTNVVGHNPFIKGFAVKANNLQIIQLYAKVTESDHGETSIQIKFHTENQG